MHRRYLAALLVLSGFCGLSYELIWVRMLSLSFGSTTLSFSTVIAVFLGGLALGSWLCGRSPRALASPVKTYAYLELATGVIGLLLYPVLRALPELFSHVDPGPGAGGLLMRLFVAILVLLPPTLLMGATLPVACAACIHDDAKLGSGTATLYGINTLGACLGTYGVTFQLFPTVGLDGAVYVTAALNFVVGAVVLACERAGVDVVAAPAQSAPDAPRNEGPNVEATSSVPLVLAFMTGFSAVAAQVVWSRLFSTYLEGTVYGVGAVLVAVLVGIGAGSMLTASTLRNGRTAARAFVFTQIILLLSLTAFWAAQPWIQFELQTLPHGLQGQRLIHTQLLAVVLLLFVPAAASGSVLPILVRVVEDRASGVPATLSKLYAVNTVGSVAGSLLGGFILLPELGTPGTAYLTTLIIALTTVLGAVRLMRADGLVRFVPPLVVLVAVPAFPEIDVARSLRSVSASENLWAHGKTVERLRSRVRYIDEGRVASVMVTENAGARGLSLNGLGQGSFAERVPHHILESLLLAYLPLFHTNRSDSALVVGLGAGATVDAMLELGVHSVRVLELEPSVVRAQAVLYPSRPPTDDPRVEVVIDDARHHLLLNGRTETRFDVIASMPAHPWVAASVFTREFFAIARHNLKPHGVFTMWFGHGRIDGDIFSSLVNAFRDVFPNYVIYDVRDAGALYFVGSPSEITVLPERLAELASAVTIRASPVPIGEVSYFLSRVMAVGDGTRPPSDSLMNTDTNLFAETRGPMVNSSTTPLDRRLSDPGLDPRILPISVRARVLTELIEERLGTPRGAVPTRIAPTRTSTAVDRLIARARPYLDLTTYEYFAARAELGHGRVDAAIAELTRLGRADDPIARRARAFAAAYDPNPARAQAALGHALDSGASDSGLWLRALDGPYRDLALQQAAASLVPAHEDPLGWFIASSAGAGALTSTDTAALTRAIGLMARTGMEDGVARLCETATERAGLTDARRACEEARAAGRRATARRALDEAVAAGRRDDYPRALEAFERAHALDPLEARALELYLQTAVYARDTRRVELAANALRVAQMPEAVIEARIDDARTRRPDTNAE